MCPVLIFVLTVLVQPSEAFPQLSSSEISRFHEPVARDLQKLSIWFHQCHIHVILTGKDVPLNLMQNPYILTTPHPLMGKSLYKRCARGHFAIPASTKMVALCQATFYINFFQVLPQAYTTQLSLAEECTKVYKLKYGHSIIFALNQKFELTKANIDHSARHPGGGNTLLVLLYALTSGISSSIAIESGLWCANIASSCNTTLCALVSKAACECRN